MSNLFFFFFACIISFSITSDDYLANLGQQGDWGTVYLDDPPEGLEELLQADAGG